MDLIESTCVIALLLRMKSKKKRRKRKHWVRPLISQKPIKGQFYKIQEDLLGHRNKFFQCVMVNHQQ
jgi:hypothetical protein